MFEVTATSGPARRGRLALRRGTVETPVFMPVGTYGTVKAMTPEELTGLGATIVLGNTFHLMLRPGTEVIRAHGGLHGFMHWPGPILTDSGGFQVFSLAELRKLSEDGVRFRSPVNGDAVFLSPEISMQVQTALDSDVVMVFDECPPYPSSEAQARQSMELSMRWDRPILTDSGGFQVMSLAKLRKITDEGVAFQSHIDGARHMLTPERAVEIQCLLGSDIQMQLDECVALPASRQETEAAMRRSLAWAERCRTAFAQFRDHGQAGPGQALFGIVQGGIDADLREGWSDVMVEMDQPGYAIGGLAVGEKQ
jgi:queuine/archaeosine tRNA-ribosyltransferase